MVAATYPVFKALLAAVWLGFRAGERFNVCKGRASSGFGFGVVPRGTGFGVEGVRVKSVGGSEVTWSRD